MLDALCCALLQGSIWGSLMAVLAIICRRNSMHSGHCALHAQQQQQQQGALQEAQQACSSSRSWVHGCICHPCLAAGHVADRSGRMHRLYCVQRMAMHVCRVLGRRLCGRVCWAVFGSVPDCYVLRSQACVSVTRCYCVAGSYGLEGPDSLQAGQALLRELLGLQLF
jgi:hypothetical protein